MLHLLLGAAFALTCDGSAPTPTVEICNAANDARDHINAVAGPGTITDGNVVARLSTERLYRVLDDVRLAAEANNCADGATIEGTVGGVYRANATTDGVWGGISMGVEGTTTGTIDRGAQSFVGTYSDLVPNEIDAIGDTLATYNKRGQLAGNRGDGADGDGFLMGQWIRVAGRNGVYVTAYGTCDEDIATSFDDWYDGALVVDEDLVDPTTFGSCGNGWTRVAHEFAEVPGGTFGPTNRSGELQYLGLSAGDAADIATSAAEGNVGPDLTFGTDYTEVLITWGDSFLCGTPGSSLFEDTVDKEIPLANVITNDSDLETAILADSGAEFCRASSFANNVRPGDTSWAIKPKDDTNLACGCNSGGWAGEGAFYGGFANGTHNSCNGWGGGFTGWRANSQQKGAYYPEYDVSILVR